DQPRPATRRDRRRAPARIDAVRRRRACRTAWPAARAHQRTTGGMTNEPCEPAAPHAADGRGCPRRAGPLRPRDHCGLRAIAGINLRGRTLAHRGEGNARTWRMAVDDRKRFTVQSSLRSDVYEDCE